MSDPFSKEMDGGGVVLEEAEVEPTPDDSPEISEDDESPSETPSDE